MTIVARKDFEPTDLKGLIDYVKANKDTVTVANAGIGAASHLCGMLFMSAIETPLVTVPYKGTGPAMTDLLGGQVDIMCDQTTNTTKQIQGGTIKAYAVTTPARLDVLPDVPTAEEGGLPGFEVGIWHGLYAPKGTPAEAIERLSKSLQVALKDPNVVARFAELGTAPSSEADATPAALKAKLESRDRALEADHRGRRPVRRLTASRHVRHRRAASDFAWSRRLSRAGDRRVASDELTTASSSQQPGDGLMKSTTFDPTNVICGAFFILIGVVFAWQSLQARTRHGCCAWARATSRWCLPCILIAARRSSSCSARSARSGEPVGIDRLARHALHPAGADLLRPDGARPRLRRRRCSSPR